MFVRWSLFCWIILVGFSTLVICEEYLHCYNEGGESSCYYWELGGMCKDMGYRAQMQRLCRKTCNLCPYTYIPPYYIPTKKTPYKACRDIERPCQMWKRYCKPGDQYYKFMKKNCARTCLQCADSGCKDLNRRCKKYERYGYCHFDHRFFNYMKRHCEKTCGFCTDDKSKVGKDVKAKKSPILERSFECNFEEHECDWTNQIFGDSGDWIIGLHDNGPSQGYNGSLKYLYTNNVHQGYKTKLLLPWQLVLPDGRKSFGNMCFHFWYQISHGRLSVYETKNPTRTVTHPNPKTLFESINFKNSWTEAKLNVKVDPKFFLQVVAEKGVRNSYIIVDNFFFTKGRC